MVNKYDAVMERIGFRYIHGDGKLRDGAIEDLEHSIGCALPTDYRTFLTKFGIKSGAGEVRYGQLDNPAAEEEASVDVFYGLRQAEAYDLQSIREAFTDILPPWLLAIASSSGGQIVLSLAGADAGWVYWWSPHRGSADTEDDLIPIAYDFDTFMRSLRVHPEE